MLVKLYAHCTCTRHLFTLYYRLRRLFTCPGWTIGHVISVVSRCILFGIFLIQGCWKFVLLGTPQIGVVVIRAQRGAAG